MRGLSSLLCLLSGCAWHLGVPPVDGGWRLEAVDAPVVEADVDDAVRAAVVAALAARRAIGEAPLAVRVTRADWSPAQRGSEGLLYEARLEVELVAGDRRRSAWATRSVVDPGSAAAAQVLRPSVFRALAAEVAAEGVAWLVDGGE